MSIRSRLLAWLLPTLATFVALIAFFFYWNWYHDIITNFKEHLQSIVVSTAELMEPEDIRWIQQHRFDKDLTNQKVYGKIFERLTRIEEKLPITDLYVVSVEPVRKGETVLLNQPLSATNPIYDGTDKSLAYRQVYLLDVRSPHGSGVIPEELAKQLHQPGEYDFSESQEHTVYFTKEPLITPIYEARETRQRLMTAYAPIIDSSGHVVALAAADVGLKMIDSQLNRALGIILLSAAITMLLVAMSVIFIANRINRPVQKLKNAALAIAAGEYGETIKVEGPKEIVELANTFNTMSECLEEHITRLRESSLIRERLYGEYECLQMLQNQMLQQAAHHFQNPWLSLKLIKVQASKPAFGAWLKIQELADHNVNITLTEALEEGFLGVYDLLSKASKESKHFPALEVRFQAKDKSIEWTENEMSAPLVWSSQKKQFVNFLQKKSLLQLGDFVFLFNRGFARQFQEHRSIQEWFNKVLRHFGHDSLEAFTTMLTTELNYLANKQVTDQDMVVIFIKVR